MIEADIAQGLLHQVDGAGEIVLSNSGRELIEQVRLISQRLSTGECLLEVSDCGHGSRVFHVVLHAFGGQTTIEAEHTISSISPLQSTPVAQPTRTTVPRYVIERDLPDIGSADRDALRAAAQKSGGVIAEMTGEGKNIQWEHTYVAGDKTFCIYIADNEGLIREHAERSGFPATTVTEIRKMIDPTTAEPA